MFKFSKKTLTEAPWLNNSEISLSAQILVRWGIIHRPKLRAYFFIVCIAILNIQQYLQVIAYIKDNKFHEIIFDAFYTVIATNVFLKCSFIMLNHTEVEDFIVYFDELVVEVEQSSDPDIQRIFGNDKKYGQIFTKLNYAFCITGACVFTIYSIVFGNGDTRMTMYNAWAPFDQVSSPNYELVFLYQFFVTITCLLIYMPWMSLMIRFMSFGATLFKFIRRSIIKSYEGFFEKESDGSYNLKNISKQSEKEILTRMRNIIVQHYKALEYASKLGSLFAQIFSVEYVVLSIILIVSLFNVNMVTTRMEIAIHVAYILMNIVLSFLINFHAELLFIENEKVLLALYDYPWYTAPKRIQFFVQMLIMKSQSPPGITVCGLVQLGVTSFQTMINRNYTYFTLLRTMMTD